MGSTRRGRRRRARRWWLAAILGALVALALAGAHVGAGLPPRAEVRGLARERPGETALMRQREEEASRRGRKAVPRQTWVPLSRVSRNLLHAVLASEDQRFFGHEGIDWEAVKESVEENVERRRLWRGGSTLTQQLAKNLYFGTERTPVRKLREVIVTRWLENDLTKPRILTLYVNVIEWGEGIYGCEAASRHWHGKPAASLTREEAAGLAAMIPNPRRINPDVNPRWFARARERVLGLMDASAFIAADVAMLGADPPPEVLILPAAPPPVPGPGEAAPAGTPEPGTSESGVPSRP